jgi:hypothetical protein
MMIAAPTYRFTRLRSGNESGENVGAASGATVGGGGRCLSRAVRKAAENSERDRDRHQEERSNVEERTGRSPGRRTDAQLMSPATGLRISRGAQS